MKTKINTKTYIFRISINGILCDHDSGNVILTNFGLNFNAIVRIIRRINTFSLINLLIELAKVWIAFIDESPKPDGNNQWGNSNSQYILQKHNLEKPFKSTRQVIDLITIFTHYYSGCIR
jgi:hypothetical protein